MNSIKKKETYEWSNIDHSSDPNDFINYLEQVNQQPGIQAYKKKAFEHLDIRPGNYILDLGCGTGQDALALAERVAPSGRVVGVDLSLTLIKKAKEKIKSTSYPVEFLHGDARELNFPDNFFHLVKSDRLLQHVEEVPQALSEMVRVTKPGGQVALMEPDWDTLVLNSSQKELTRLLIHFRCDQIRQGWIGRELKSNLQNHGLLEIQVFPKTLILSNFQIANHIFRLTTLVENAQQENIITPKQASEWLHCLQDLDKKGRFFSAITGFFVKGIKP